MTLKKFRFHLRLSRNESRFASWKSKTHPIYATNGFTLLVRAVSVQPCLSFALGLKPSPQTPAPWS